jgi:hypothetical protein
MDKIKTFLRPRRPAYKSLDRQDTQDQDQDQAPLMGHETEDSFETSSDAGSEEPFRWSYYAIFMLLGIAMLWAWYIHIRKKSCCVRNNLA